MDLQNSYKVIYEKIADGERTFFADRMDGTGAAQIGKAIKVGQYKLVFEKDGKIYGSESGKIEDGVCLEAFNEVFVKTEEGHEPAEANVEPEAGKPDIEEPEQHPEPEDDKEPSEPDDEE